MDTHSSHSQAAGRKAIDVGLPTGPALEQMVLQCLRAWQAEALADRIRVGYNSRLTTTLGRAILDDYRVELNPRLLAEHPDEAFATLAHELAHLVVRHRYPRAASHGREFRTLMRAMNLSGRATHQLPVGHLRRKRSRYLYLHRCSDCGYSFVAGSIRRHVCCAACGPSMEWDIFRLPNNASGRKLMDRLLSAARRRQGGA